MHETFILNWLESILFHLEMRTLLPGVNAGQALMLKTEGRQGWFLHENRTLFLAQLNF